MDRALEDPDFSRRYEFTYIGNLPEGMKFRNVRYLSPLSGAALAGELRQHHIYVTASVNEPGSNHQNEGALCGLPLVYVGQGSMEEYCQGFGEPFRNGQWRAPLEKVAAAYPEWRGKRRNFPYTSTRMANAYATLFEELMDSRPVRKRWLPFF